MRWALVIGAVVLSFYGLIHLCIDLAHAVEWFGSHVIVIQK